jgi:hypothetical protein
MRLEPQDLGTRWHILLVQERTQKWWSRLWRRNDIPEPRLGVLGRRWRRGLEKGGLQITPEAAAATFPLSAGETLGAVYGLGVGTAVFAAGTLAAAAGFGDVSPVGAAATLGATGVGGWLGMFTVPQAMLRRLHRRPLTEEEIQSALGMVAGGPFFQRLAAQILARFGEPGPVANDPLEKAFLSLALETIRRDVPEAAQKDIRAALRALGEAIAGLPPPVETSDEAPALRQQAAAFAERARDETDHVVAASWERQAEALERQADAADEANRIARRVRVLRQEMATQIAAMRAGLNALDTCLADDARDLAHCAETVRTVASEAVAVARARQELDDVPRAPTTRPAATDESTVLRAGRR